MNVFKNFSKLAFHRGRNSVKINILRQSTAAANAVATEPITIPMPESEKMFSPKLEKIANDISSLNLLEVSELTQLIKKKLNLPDQPMMPMGGFVMQASAPQGDDDSASQPQKVQMDFTVKIKSFDDKQKVALIKEIKNCMEGFNLVQAKKFIESLPGIVREKIPKEEADKLKEVLSKVGAQVVIE